MKVLAITDARIDLLRALAAAPRVELSILADPDAVPRFEAAGFGLSAQPFWPKSKLDLAAASRLRRLVRQSRPDVICAFTSRGLASALQATAFMAAPPRIVAWRGIASVPSRTDPSNYLSYLHHRVAGFACISDAAKQCLLRAGVPEKKCVTTYVCGPSHNGSHPGRAALASCNVPEEAFVVGTVANIRRVKGIDILLRAALECADLDRVHWVVVGDRAKAEPSIDRLARDSRLSGRVHMIGFRRDAQALMSGFDLFAMASRSEGLCRALLEAMSQGICPVVSDAGGMKEAVRHGRDGLVVPTGDPAALAGALRELSTNRDLRERFGRSARERAVHVFAPDRVAERLVALFDRVLTAKPTGRRCPGVRPAA